MNDDSTLILVDFGEIAPRYKGDVEAAADLLEWCLAFEFTEGERKLLLDSVKCLRCNDIARCD